MSTLAFLSPDQNFQDGDGPIFQSITKNIFSLVLTIFLLSFRCKTCLHFEILLMRKSVFQDYPDRTQNKLLCQLPCLMPLLFPCYCYVIYTIIKELQVNKQLKHVNSLLPNMNSTIMWFWIIKASPLPLQLTKIMKISHKNSNLLYEMLLHIGKILKKRSPKIVEPVHDKYWLVFLYVSQFSHD